MQTVTSNDGTAIAFDTFGSGPPLILVGGAIATRAAAGSAARLLGEHFTVYAYDRRGRGDSGDTLPYAFEREIEDLAALIEESGGAAYVFGHSSGAVLSLRAAARGLAITKLAVYEPPFIVDDSRPPVPDNFVTHLDELIAAGRRSDALTYFMTAAVGMPEEAVAGMREGPMWESSAAVAHTLAYDGRIMSGLMSGKPLAREPWSAIAVPTLVIDGGASEPFMHSGADALAAHVPHAQRTTLADQDHGPADDVLMPVLVDFFAG
jgi:pimeloyl-ACP methyl ester carboxylesterase